MVGETDGRCAILTIMKTFTIDKDNHVLAYASEALRAQHEPGIAAFTNHAEFKALAGNWPAARLVAIWNNLPGVTAVKKFTDRSAAARRIWQAIQNLEPLPEPAPPPTARKPLRGVPRQNSKKARVLEMLGRTEGATVKEIMSATAWQPHTVRGFLSGTVGRRLGLPVTSERRSDGERAYKLPATMPGDSR